MLYVFVAFLIAAQGTSTSAPSPAPTPLKQIAHTRSSAFCTALRENVGVAIAGVLIDDQVIAQAKPTLLMLGREFVMNHARSNWAEFDRVRLEEIAGSLAQNLATIDKVLSDPRFVSNPQTADDRALADMKARLQAVADRQKEALNLVSGVAETYSLEDLNSQPSGLKGAAQPDINPGANGANTGMFNQTVVQFQNNQSQQTSRGQQALGAQNITPISGDPRFTITASDLANNPFGRFFAAVVIGEMQTGKLESAAAAPVIAGSALCQP